MLLHSADKRIARIKFSKVYNFRNHHLPFDLMILLFLSLVNIQAQEIHPIIHPALQVVLSKTSIGEKVDVYASLKDRYPLEELKQQICLFSKKEKRKEIVKTLKAFASEKQQAILRFLNEAQQQNKVTKLDILWALNTIVFSANKEVIYSLANNFDEIEEIRYDPKFSTIHNEEPTTNNPLGLTSVIDGKDRGLVLMGVPDVWAEGYYGQGVLAASIDEGCYWEHPDLLNNLWQNLAEDADGDGNTIELVSGKWELDPGDLNEIDDDNNGYVDDLLGWDFVDGDNQVRGVNHGTKSAGTLVGDGTLGVQTGVAPQAKIINLRIGTDSEQQQTYCWLAMQYAIELGVDIITHSQSFHWDDGPPDVETFRDMAVLELEAGIIHFTSISNDGNTIGVPFNISVPGNCPPPWLHPEQTLIGGLSSIMGIGNVNAYSGVIISTSPYGPSSQENYRETWGSSYDIYGIMPEEYQDYPYGNGSMGLLKPDVSAPGTSTESLKRFSDGTYGYDGYGGTSSAAPHAAGLAVLLLSVNPLLTPANICEILKISSIDKGESGHDNRYGAGTLDAYAAYILTINALPVELISFTSSLSESAVTLKWITATETNNSGFEIQRKLDNSVWKKLGFVEGHGTTTEIQNYQFIDNISDIQTTSISYRLKQIDFEGSYEYSDVVEVTNLAPADFVLHQNFPNPFNPTTKIKYGLPDPGLVTIRVYDVLGVAVASVVNEEKAAGSYEVNFDATKLSSGIYFYTLQAGSFVETKKMVLLR